MSPSRLPQWLVGSILLLAPSALAQSSLRSFEDAGLNAVAFIDRHEGWAVGDQGVVWHTIDGGQTWERQPTGVQATLTSIDMHDFRIGWIGGRESVPYSAASAGFVLQTTDGGGRWIRPEQQYLAGVQVIRLLGEEGGWALTEPTDSHPSGLFLASPDGLAWNPLKGRRQPGWTAAAFFDFGTALFGGHAGSLVHFQKGKQTPLTFPWKHQASVRDIARSGKRVWVVGDCGNVAVSADSGKTWSKPKLPVPDELQLLWDFRSVAAIGDSAWILGRPGSLVLHTWNGGNDWKIQKTGVPMPLNDVCFADPLNGFAVGALGTILATQNGGEEWTVQRQGGSRSALLWLVSDPRNIPLSVVAAYGGAEGFRIATFALTGPSADDAEDGAFHRPARFAQALRAVGGAAAETSTRFALPQSESQDTLRASFTRWNEMHGGDAAAAIERELVLALRIWRPDIVLADAPDVRSGASLESIVGQGAQRAFSVAADPLFFPDQIEFFGLNPHAPGRLYVSGQNAAQAQYAFEAHETSPRLGRSFADLADEGLAIARDEYEPTESVVRYSILEATDAKLKETKRHTSLTAGLALKPGGEARRPLEEVQLSEAAEAKQKERSQKKRNLLAIASKVGPTITPDSVLGQLKEATTDLDMRQAGQVAFQVGRRFVELGRWDLGYATFKHLMDNNPQHPLALEAYRWSISYLTSDEARMRFPTVASPLGGAGATEPVTEKTSDPKTERADKNTAAPLTQADLDKQTVREALRLGQRLKATSPHLWADPRVQLTLAAAHRKIDEANSAAAIESQLKVVDTDADSRWSRLVALERGESSKRTEPAIVFCGESTSRPYLDGKLDEPFWAEGCHLTLGSGPRDRMVSAAGEAFLHRDAEFLYLAARCPILPGQSIPDPEKRTGHDADVTGQDRVEFLFDVDRDYSTYYRIRVDVRGLAAEDCWGHSGWNPKMFVACDRDDKEWRFEAAIPIRELSANPALTKQTWTFNVMRVVPDHETFAWGRPASAAIRVEGFGHLRFVERAPKQGLPPQAN